MGICKSAVASILTFVVLSGPASAEPNCENGAQLVKGNWMATPWCQDKLLAEVAISRGFKTTFAAIRNDPNHKKELCRFLFSDIRVEGTCLDAGVPEYYGR